MKSITVGNRTSIQKYFSDPLIGLLVGIVILILKMLPLSAARFLGESFGSFVGLVARRRNKIALVNLQLAFPHKTSQERRMILKKMWRHFGRVFAEVLHIQKVMTSAQFKGVDYLREVYQKGKGGFVCSAHLGNWEIPLGSQVAPGFFLNPVFRTANNPWLNKLLFSHRQGTPIPKGPKGARMMIKLLEKNAFISILCDQKFREGILVPFFNHPAQTATAMASLAFKFKLPIIMCRCIYQKDKTYLIEILPPLKLPKIKNKQQAEFQIMLQINQIYEKWLMETPEQWLWVHRRFPKNVYRKLGIY